MKRLSLCIILLLSSAAAFAQSEDEFKRMEEEMKRQFMDFDKQSRHNYSSFRDECNKTFIDFISLSWEVFEGKKAMPVPHLEEVPPVVIDDNEKQKPLEDKPIVIEETIPAPKPEPQPQPIEPVTPTPAPVSQFEFTLFGAQFQLPVPNGTPFVLQDISKPSIAKAWEQLSDHRYDNLVAACLDLRSRHQLCDWSYLQLISSFCNQYLSSGSNEAELLKAFLFSQSGYQMRLAISNGHLFMLFASRHTIYDYNYYIIEGMAYYSERPLSGKIQVCPGKFPNEAPLSLSISQEQILPSHSFVDRTLSSSDRTNFPIKVSTDQNLMNFCQSYPPSCYDNNFMTRWSLYAQMPLSQHLRQQLYPQLRHIIDGKSNYEAVDLICHWIQTAFEYEYDDKVWGKDRAFFADETLHYPYCDCEDRSILLTRIVRDLLGLKCALVYYPGHLATAIALGEDAKGDYIRYNGTKYLICDPTFINAPIGRTMTGMDNSSARIIIL